MRGQGRDISQGNQRRARRPGEHRTSAQARERILTATLDVAREYGYNGLTIARVSTASGMPSGSVYWHFANKDGLLRAALDLSFEKQLSNLAALGPEAGEDVHHFIDRLTAIMRASVEPWEFWRIGTTLISDETVPEQETLQRFRLLRHEVRGLYEQWWQQVLPESGTDEGRVLVRQLAEFLLQMQDGFSLSLAAGDATEPSGERLAAFAAALHALVGVRTSAV